jgi:hypothetical protein
MAYNAKKQHKLIELNDNKDATGVGAGPDYEYSRAQERLDHMAQNDWEVVAVLSHKDALIAVLRKDA